MQERRNSIADALEVHLSCTNPSNYTCVCVNSNQYAWACYHVCIFYVQHSACILYCCLVSIRSEHIWHSVVTAQMVSFDLWSAACHGKEYDEMYAILAWVKLNYDIIALVNSLRLVQNMSNRSLFSLKKIFIFWFKKFWLKFVFLVFPNANK